MEKRDLPLLQRLSPPAVTLLVCFLAYSSQWLFYHLQPGPLRASDAYTFNTLVICLLICYWRTCLTDPGRIPHDWHETVSDAGSSVSFSDSTKTATKAAVQSNRWCRRCEAYKPPRAHHCKTCKRCVMKMDHHCVWTANCVSHITIPHFARFLFYAVVSMAYLEYFLFQRVSIIWQQRSLPSYLGPSILKLAHIFVLSITNSFILFALTLLLGRTIWCLAVNTYTIESWEIERHHTLLRRARALGGWLDGPNGHRIRIQHQEFPWDVGILTNICQGMGTRNPLAWFWPFAQSPSVASGLAFEHNEIDDPSKPWPPPDPDRLFKVERKPLVGDGFTKSWDVDDFKQRQKADMSLRYGNGGDVVRRRPFHERVGDAAMRQGRDDGEDYYNGNEEFSEDDDSEEEFAIEDPRGENDDGEEAWRNKEGERLADFGVDEMADFYDEDDLPLAELIRRRKGEAATS